MYRNYEDPYKLEEQLENLREEYCTALENGDEDTLIYLDYEINELMERINFAWQDEEYDGYY